MIERALDAGVPFAWFAADEEFGQNPGPARAPSRYGVCPERRVKAM